VQTIDWIVLALYFLLMVGIGVWSYRQVNNSQDFFAAGGRMPWWLAGISHHVSGYSAVAFTGYAAVAYTEGFTLYVWWAVTVAIALFFGAILIAPRWARLRGRYKIESPLEYLKTRYNLPTQQLLAYSGSLLKIFDVGAKYASIAIFLDVLAGVPLYVGIILAGVVSLVYVTIGGLWADALNDFAQFVIQVLATTILFVVVLAELGGAGAIFGMWERLPEGHTSLFAGEYTPVFVLAFLLITFLSYSGGTWNLAQRFIASPMGSDARKAAFLSAALYLTLPLVMFFPMWAAPIFFPNIGNPEEVYGIMAREFLPPGMVGLVLAGMFAATMSMTASDSNAVSAVVTRDMLPVAFRGLRNMSQERSLLIGRVTTFLFTALTLLVAINAETFGGIIGLVVVWFAGLLGPTAIPMILGLLPAFRHSGPTAAIVSTLAGVATFAVANFVFQGPFVATTGLPVVVSAVIFIGLGLVNWGRAVAPEVDDLLEAINEDRVVPQPSPATTATGLERGS
jgi:SSS family solute:Na+ symporter